MPNSPIDLAGLLRRAGFRSSNKAVPTRIPVVESAFGITFPDDFRELWTLSDGMSGDGIELMSLESVEKYVEMFRGGPSFIPFGDCNDSNPYVACCREPLRGMIAHIFHDDDPCLVCRGLPRFLELVTESCRDDSDVGRLVGDFDFSHPDRTSEDANIARELIKQAEVFDQEHSFWGDTLRFFAAQLFGPGQEDELAALMMVGNEYTRDVVIRRLHGLGTSAADDQLRKDKAEFEEFVMQIRGRFEAAGFRTETDRRGNLRLQPGNVGPNLPSLFADRHRPGSMDEWVARFAERAGLK